MHHPQTKLLLVGGQPFPTSVELKRQLEKSDLRSVCRCVNILRLEGSYLKCLLNQPNNAILDADKGGFCG